MPIKQVNFWEKHENFPKNMLKPNPFLIPNSNSVNEHKACYAYFSFTIMNWFLTMLIKRLTEIKNIPPCRERKYWQNIINHWCKYEILSQNWKQLNLQKLKQKQLKSEALVLLPGLILMSKIKQRQRYVINHLIMKKSLKMYLRLIYL